MLKLAPDSWFAVQVVPRSEKRVGSILEYKGYQQFSPTYISRRQWSDRVKTLEKPLFPGYIFVQTTEKKVGGLICSTPGAMRILTFGGRPCSIPAFEIDAVRTLTLLGKPLPLPHLNVGQQVEIMEGPFTGIIGIVRQIKDRASLVVSIQLISQSIYVDIEGTKLRPVAATVGVADRPQPSSAVFPTKDVVQGIPLASSPMLLPAQRDRANNSPT